MVGHDNIYRRGRFAFLSIGFMCGFVGVLYYGSVQIRAHGVPYMIGLTTTPSDVKPVVTSQMDRSNKANFQVSKSILYDLNTYGLKLYKCSRKNSMASQKHSKIRMLFYNKTEANYIIIVDLYDNRRIRRTTGGDVIVMWSEQVSGDGRVSGTVLDNMNGSYTGKFKIYWTGPTVFKAKITSTVENQCLRSNALYRYGNTVYAKQKGWGIHAVFQLRNKIYQTKCGANAYIYRSPKLCNFTTLNADLPWYCGAPPRTDASALKCSDIERFTIGPFDTSTIPANEKMTNVGHGVIDDTREVEVKHKSDIDNWMKCSNFPSRNTWTYTQPTGFWANGRWNFISCDNSAMSFQYSAYRTCLRGKYLAVIGDSTVRQLVEFLMSRVLDIGIINLKDGLGTGPKRAYQVHKEFKKFNITMSYSKHEFPFHNINFPPNNITSMPLELQRLESSKLPGKDLVVLLHYNQHFQAYPIEAFHLRIRRLVPVIKRLINVKPGIKILFKGPHMIIDDVRWFDPRISLIYMDILHKEFHQLRDHVIYFDTWSSSVAHNSENPHPSGVAFHSMIHQLMSYICTY